MGEQRTYTSSLRAERAVATRLAILDAAHRCFAANGFAGATVKAIAEEAGVSAPTIYATFGSKGAMVVALIDQIEQQAMAGRESVREDAEHPDARLDAWVADHGRIFHVGMDLFRPLMEALGEPDVRAMKRTGDDHRRAALESVVEGFAQAGRLRSDLTPKSAVDQAWVVSSAETYVLLVERCDWSHQEYLDWLGETIRRLWVGPRR